MVVLQHVVSLRCADKKPVAVELTVLAAISYEPLVRIHLGPLAISPHGVFTALGFLIGAQFLLRETRRKGIADEAVHAMLLRALIGALVGARVVYVLNQLSNFDSPIEWFKVWEGGISLLGGIAGALLASAPEARRRGIGFFRIVDLAAPWLPLGIAVGRIGDLIIADHLGGVTDLPFGFRCPDVVDVGRTVGSPCPPGEVVHLTAAYDLVIALAVCAVLFLLRGRLLRLGERTLLLGILYGSGRFIFDFLREDTRRFGLTGSQWTALGLVVLGSALLLRRRRSELPAERVTDPVGPEATAADAEDPHAVSGT